MFDFTRFVMAGALVGTVLNIYKRKEGFLLWAITNGIWMVIDWQAGLYAQAVQFAVYLLLAVWGYWRWK